MTKLQAGSLALAALIGFIVLITFVGFLFAYPTMWLVNYLFSTTFLYFVFGVAKLSLAGLGVEHRFRYSV